MSTQKKELYEIIENMPDEFSSKVLEYIEYLNFVYASNKAPEELIIKDTKDLNKKLKKGIDDTNSGKVYPIEDVFDEVEKILAK